MSDITTTKAANAYRMMTHVSETESACMISRAIVVFKKKFMPICEMTILLMTIAFGALTNSLLAAVVKHGWMRTEMQKITFQRVRSNSFGDFAVRL